MLVRFSSPKTESILMFADTAKQLIRMLGGSGNIPGAVSAEDIPSALEKLRNGLRNAASSGVDTARSVGKENDDSHDAVDEDQEPPVALTTRAGPLIAILERASAAQAPVMWESPQSGQAFG